MSTDNGFGSSLQQCLRRIRHKNTAYRFSNVTKARTQQLLASLGVSYGARRSTELEGWDCYSLNHSSKSSSIPILVVESGPKNITEVKQAIKRFDSCVILASNLRKLFISTLEKTYMVSLDSDAEYDRIARILETNNVGTAKNGFEFNANLENAIDAIPSTTGDFENRGLFSTHYLRNRIFDDAQDNVDVTVLRDARTDTKALLEALGWRITDLGGGIKEK